MRTITRLTGKGGGWVAYWGEKEDFPNMMMNGVCKMVKKVKRVLAVVITLVLMVSMLGNSKLIVFAENNVTSEQELAEIATVAEEEITSAEEMSMDGEDKQTELSTDRKNSATSKQEKSQETEKEIHAGESGQASTSETAVINETEAKINTSEKVTAVSEENKEEKPTVAENNTTSEQEKNQESVDKTTKENESTQEQQDISQNTTEQEQQDTLQSITNEEQQSIAENSAEQEAKPYEAEAVVDQTRIKVTAEAGVLPSDAVLNAKALKEDGDTSAQYNEAKAALDKENSIEYDGFMAYDIGFTDSIGQKIEPTGKVSVSMEMATPEGAESESLSVQHHEETASGIQVETVADAKNETSGKVDVKGQETVAEFEVESFSTFTITWSSGNTTYFNITVHYVNTNGAEIDEPTHSDMTISNGKTITLSDLAPNVSGLTYQKAYYGSFGGSEITSVEASQSGSSSNRTRNLTFKNGDSTVESLSYSRWDSSTKKADIYLEYKTDNITPPSPTPTKSLSKSKTVDRNEDGTYDLNLSISGAVGTVTNKAKLDILLIIDRSGSMEDEERMENAKTAANNLIDTVNRRSDTIDAQYAVVSFCSGYNRQYGTYNGYYYQNANGPAKASNTEQSWTNNVNNVKTSINNIEVGGGTNYQSGINLGKTVLKESRTDAQKVVIFLTDGLPTCALNIQSGEYTQDGDGTSYAERYQNSAVGEIKGMGCDQFYAIGVGSDFENANSTAKKNLDELAANVGQEAGQTPSKSVVYAASSSDLSKIFDDIAASTTSFLCDHVNVTDTLSENVEVVADASGTPTNLLITVTKADGTELTSQGSEITKDENGNYVTSITLPATEENKEATIRAIYSNGQIQMEFPPDYKLEANWDYKVTTTIKATETAYQKYRENGYTDTADGGTGTHATDVGFYSNNNDEAKVTYTYDEKNEEELFDKPVIQLNPGTLVIEKEITGLSEDEITTLLSKLQFDVTLNNGVSTPYSTTVFTKVDDYNGEGVKYTYTISGLSPDTSYTVGEKDGTANMAGYDLNTSVSGDVTGTVPGGETKTVTFTNAYTHSNRTITVKKIVTGNMADVDKEFDFTYKIGDGGEGNEGTFKLINNGTKDITVPYGSNITITETDYSSDGYKTTWKIGESGEDSEEISSSYTLTNITENMTDADKMLICVNHKDGNPPTGITTTQAPFTLMLIAALFLAICGVGGFMLRRVRGRR